MPWIKSVQWERDNKKAYSMKSISICGTDLTATGMRTCLYLLTVTILTLNCSKVEAEKNLEIKVAPDVIAGKVTEVKCIPHFVSFYDPFLVNNEKHFKDPHRRMEDQMVIYTFNVTLEEGSVWCLMKSHSDSITSNQVVILKGAVNNGAVQLQSLPHVTRAGQSIILNCTTTETGNYFPQLSMNGHLYNETNRMIKGEQLVYRFAVKADPGTVYCILKYPDRSVLSQSGQLLLGVDNTDQYPSSTSVRLWASCTVIALLASGI